MERKRDNNTGKKVAGVKREKRRKIKRQQEKSIIAIAEKKAI